MVSEHISEAALEHYLLGDDTLDSAALETHLLGCETCSERVREQLALETSLGQVAAAATFCPGCGRGVAGDRCDQCGATSVAGGYRIERVLVKTTHGRLYAAVDGHGNRVALKELAFVQAPTLETLAAFDRETKFLRALSHPCIPKFHASFIEGTGIHTRMYIAQDLVEGESLLARMQTHWFDEREIVRIARAVLEILIYLQSLSPMVFHRDIKPANLISRVDGSFALVDFGAARDVSDTMGNTAVGTFGYMPMEQMAGVYDATTDLYALGASLYHLLTRREPWKLLEGSGGRPANISPDLRIYLDKLMARRPEDRFPNARAALDALLARRPPPTRRRRALLAGGLVALCGVGVTVGVVASGSEHGSGTERALALAKMESMTVEMCACRDRTCVDRVNAEFTKWGAEQTRRSSEGPREEPDLATQRRWAEVTTRYTECKIRIASKETSTAPRTEWRPTPPIRKPARVATRTSITAAGPVITTSGDPVHGYLGSCPIASRLPTGKCPEGSAEIVLPDRAAAALEELETRKPALAKRLRERLIQLARDSQPIVIGRLKADVDEVLTSSLGTFHDGYFVLDAREAPFTIEVAGYQDVAIDAIRARSIRWLGEIELVRRTGGTGTLEVSSKPAARISVDGADTGETTPAVFKLSPGRHKITFSHGATRSSFFVVIKASETIKLSKQLE